MLKVSFSISSTILIALLIGLFAVFYADIDKGEIL